MGKKGISAEEKRERLLAWFREHKTFVSLKEIEKGGSKATGISSMVMKDVLTQLTDDNLVDFDKIGSGNYYWSFPSKVLQRRKRDLADLESELEGGEAKKNRLMDSVQKARVGRDESDARKELLKNLNKNREMEAKLSQDLKRFEDCDPEVLRAKEQKAKDAKEQANRWTDNVFVAKSWVANKFGGQYNEKAFNQQMAIPNDLDYLE